MKNRFYYIVIIFFLFTTSCLEEGSPLFSFRSLTAELMVTNDSAYLYHSALIDTVTDLNFIDAEVQGDIFGISDSFDIISYGHCWLINENFDTLNLEYPEVNDSRTIFKIKSDTVTTLSGDDEISFTSFLNPLLVDQLYYIRTFIITENISSGKIDTGYNQVVTTFRTRTPRDVWFYVGSIADQGTFGVREDAVSFVLEEDGKEYAYITTGSKTNANVNGEIVNNTPMQDTWKYDYQTETWESRANFQDKRDRAVAFVIDNEGYVGTGTYTYEDDNDPMPEKDFYKYNPVNNEWTSWGAGIDSMPENAERYDAVAFSIKVNGKEYGYVGLGAWEDKRLRKDFYRFDPTASEGSQWKWQKNYPMLDDEAGKIEAVAAVVNNIAIVGSGLSGNNNTDAYYTKDFYKYDAESNEWASISTFPGNPRADAVAFGLSFERDGVQKNYFYVATGRTETSGVLLNDLWAYDTDLSTWKNKSDIEDNGDVAEAREGGVAFSINKSHVAYGATARAYVLLGKKVDGSTYLMTKFWEYLP